MQKCENCGNEYAKAFQVILNDGTTHVFDSFECAINTVAPRCEHCETRVIGHGVEHGEHIFCCVRCAEMHGVEGLRDHLD
ncbi:MAG: hypothetical protein AB7G93_18545 [Bdellovibrionales bacterium]